MTITTDPYETAPPKQKLMTSPKVKMTLQEYLDKYPEIVDVARLKRMDSVAVSNYATRLVYDADYYDDVIITSANIAVLYNFRKMNK